METALENLSKEKLIKLLSSRDEVLTDQNKQLKSLTKDSSKKDEKIADLNQQLAMYKRMQFGQKRECFEGDPNQIMLPFQVDPAEARRQQEEIKQKIEYIRKRPNHPGRAQLPVEEIEIHPEGDLSEMVCMDKEIIDELECEPAKFYIKRSFCYKYVAKRRCQDRISAIDKRITGFLLWM